LASCAGYSDYFVMVDEVRGLVEPPDPIGRVRRMGAVRHVPALAAAGLAALAIPASAAAQHKAPPPVTVQASNFRFCAAGGSGCLPERDDNHVTTVPVGTRVTWVYTDMLCDLVVPCPGHNVVFTNGGGNKTLIKKQGAVLLRMTFSRPGRYSYFCTAHQSFGMTGTVVVTRK
jgi:hypothetical protein